jgi:hypothetical protein
LAAANAAAPAAATSVTGLSGTPLEAVAALVGTAMAVGAAPPGLAGKERRRLLPHGRQQGAQALASAA